MRTTDVPPLPAHRVSVIIPTYNRADYLPQAIDSVLQQSLGGIEIIVVDDGSTDGTPDVIASYGNRVTYVTTEHGGVAHARNVGVRQATGEYLAFLDSDDLFYPYMLELESRVLDRFPAVGFVYAEMSAFDDAGFFDRYHLKTYHGSAYRDPALTYDRIFERSARLGDLGILPSALVQQDPEVAERRAYFGNVFDEYLMRLVVFQNNVLMRRSLVCSVGLRNEAVRYWEEYDYLLRIARRHEACFLDVPTYKLRYHPGQVSSTAGERGRYVWIRKQQGLLRVVQRHATAEPAYFAAHRARLEAQFAHLHRAVAVPLLLAPGSRRRRRDLARRARTHLRRAWRYGERHPALWLMSFVPGRVRRVLWGSADYVRAWARRRRAAWAGHRSPR